MSASNVLAFEVFRGADLIARQRFSEPSVTIGRGQSALFRVDDGSVSDIHCVLNMEPDGSVMLLDLNSKQGTIFQGKRVPSAQLRSGDEFFVGILRFRVTIEGAGVAPGIAEEEPTEFPREEPTQEAAPRPTPAPQPVRQAPVAPVAAAPMAAAAASGTFRTANIEEEGDIEFEDDVIIEDGMSFVMRAGTATHNIGVNVKRPKVLEVNQVWGDTLMDSRHFPHTGQKVTIGSSLGHRWHFLGVDMGWIPAPLNLVLPFTPPMWSEVYSSWRNDFYAPTENLPGKRDHDLFTFENEQYVAHVDKTWDGFVDIEDKRYSFEQLVQAGRASVDGNEYTIPVTDDVRLAVDIEGVTYFSHKVLAGSKLLSRAAEDPDYPFIAISAFMGFLGLMFGLIIYFMPPRPSLGVDEIPDRFVEMTIDKPEPEEKMDKKPEANPDAGEGAKAKEDEGKVGKKDAKMEKAKGNKVDIQKAQKDREIAENAGLLGAMQDAGGMDGVFGSSALDSSLTGGVGGLIGVKGTQIGAGGLGSRGSGLGGGGTAGGLGGLGTKGMGSGKSGYGSGGGNFGAKGEGGIGKVGGDPIILGALDRSLIDAVIKRNMNQIRYCYQRELAKKPSLGGKIVIKFVIAKDGSVSSASKKESTMNSAPVEQCIVGRFMRMKFPEPKGGGIVIVSYPFLFSPG
ncbi:MAG: AgmX/PglI C-terminal domain-containing protein [Alphaproteobacteria bacterium]|nr:AgmX/PglI C-terminal domain-containing protein [Alphaproteobacteria bacterium]MCB9692802.1 AgmX/PglI C-terminal domain-containing protein [Alphaproteobacteria bacterium]